MKSLVVIPILLLVGCSSFGPGGVGRTLPPSTDSRVSPSSHRLSSPGTEARAIPARSSRRVAAQAPAVERVRYCGERLDGSCRADLNRDGSIDVTDLNLLLAAWGTVDYDLDPIGCDGVLNTTDLLLLLGDWGAISRTENPL